MHNSGTFQTSLTWLCIFCFSSCLLVWDDYFVFLPEVAHPTQAADTAPLNFTLQHLSFLFCIFFFSLSPDNSNLLGKNYHFTHLKKPSIDPVIISSYHSVSLLYLTAKSFPKGAHFISLILPSLII